MQTILISKTLAFRKPHLYFLKHGSIEEWFMVWQLVGMAVDIRYARGDNGPLVPVKFLQGELCR